MTAILQRPLYTTYSEAALQESGRWLADSVGLPVLAPATKLVMGKPGGFGLDPLALLPRQFVSCMSGIDGACGPPAEGGDDDSDGGG